MTEKERERMENFILYLQFVIEMIGLGFYALWVATKRLISFIVPNKRKSIKGEVILITGGANGIGREICRCLCQHETDFTLISWDADDKRNEELVNEVLNFGVKKVYGFTVDVSDSGQVEAAAKRVREEIGGVTVLINNAGICGKLGDGWVIDPENIEKVLRVNLLAQCWTLRQFIPDMLEKNYGHIVSLCSALSFSAGPSGAAYIASKHAVKGYMESIKLDLRQRPDATNIKVTMALPHHTVTNLTATANLHAGKYPWLFPQQSPKCVASKIVTGFLRDDEYVYTPGYLRLLHMFLAAFPPEVLRRSMDIADIKPQPHFKAKPA